MKKNYRSHNQKGKQSFFAILFCLTLALQMVHGITVVPRTVYANLNWNSVETGKNLERVYNFIEGCAGGRLNLTHKNNAGGGSVGVKLAEDFDLGQANKGEIFHKEVRSLGFDVHTGEADYPISRLFETNSATCQGTTAKLAIAALYGSYEAFLDKFYTIDTSGDNPKYVIKAEWEWSKGETKILNELRGRSIELGYHTPLPMGNINDTPEYRYMTLKPSFDECFVADSTATGDNLFTRNGITYRIRGTGNGDSGSVKWVGAILDRDSSMGGQLGAMDGDGKWNCGEFMRHITGDSASYFDILFTSEEDRNKDARTDAIDEVLDSDPNKLIWCVASQAPNLARETTERQQEIITSWLASGGSGEISFTPTGGGGRRDVVATDKAAAIAQCLREAFPELTEATSTTIETADGKNADDGDTCESRGGPFGWVLCFIFEQIVNALDKFAGFVQERLDVSLQDSDSLESAWGSMRTIANIIFVFAFLFIIISQTIVGRF